MDASVAGSNCTDRRRSIRGRGNIHTEAGSVTPLTTRTSSRRRDWRGRYVPDLAKPLRPRRTRRPPVGGVLRPMLGFRIVAEPDGWVFVAQDNCMIMLGECPDDLPAGELGCHSYFAYLRVADADAYYDDLKAKGADLLSAIADKPWRMREFGLRTVDGHRIMIGHSLAG